MSRHLSPLSASDWASECLVWAHIAIHHDAEISTELTLCGVNSFTHRYNKLIHRYTLTDYFISIFVYCRHFWLVQTTVVFDFWYARNTLIQDLVSSNVLIVKHLRPSPLLHIYWSKIWPCFYFFSSDSDSLPEWVRAYSKWSDALRPHDETRNDSDTNPVGTDTITAHRTAHAY